MNRMKRYSTLICMLALAFLVFAVAHNRRATMEEGVKPTSIVSLPFGKDKKAQGAGEWTPNETLTGTVLAANFAQDQRDWALANFYIDKLTNPSANDAPTVMRMMLLALSAGQFDRAADYAGKLEKMTAKESATQRDATATPAGDGHDLASVVLLARAIRSGDLPAAQAHLNGVRSTALSAFIQPVLSSWLKAGQKQPLDSGVDGLSLLQGLHRGLAAEWAGQKDVSNRAFDALARLPLTPSAAMTVAAYNIRQGRVDAARAALQSALRQNPMNRDAKAMLDALSQGQTPAMKPQWSFHLQGVSAGAGMAFMDLAQVMLADRANDSALIFAQMGRMIRQDVPGLSLLVAAIFQEEKRTDDAVKVLSSVQPADIDYIDAQVQLAELKAAEDDNAAAIQILESLMGKTPTPRVAYALGEIYRQNKDFKKAVAAYDQVVSLSGGKADDDLWSVYFVRAMAYDELDQWDKAEADLKTALEYRPENPHVLNFLGYSWADKNMHLQEARDMITLALGRAPTDPYITDSLGWVYFKENNFKDATELLERAVSLKPYDPVLNDHLGDVYQKTGRTLEARYQWRRALDYADAEKDADLIKTITDKLEANQAK